MMSQSLLLLNILMGVEGKYGFTVSDGWCS